MTYQSNANELEIAMNQAPMTVQGFFYKAISIIDKEFGAGYAAKNPELLGAFITACSIDEFATIMHNRLESIDRELNQLSIAIDQKS